MPFTDASERLRTEIVAEIEARGPIPFARFMELCLYHPVLGYYTRGLGGGGGRDYLTSSGIHRAFGHLLARQVEEMWRRAGRPDPYYFVEFGPGEGYFALDFLQEAARSGGFAKSLCYVMVEPSPVLAERQRSRLAGPASTAVHWLGEQDLDRRAKFPGCLFANEVLDAFPVHRVMGTPEGPLEIHVAVRAGRTQEILAPLSSEAVGRFLSESGIVLEDGQEIDLNLAAPCWVSWAVGLLRRGYLIVVDYGHEAPELYAPRRRRGTLLAYHRHRINEDFLERPGEQDLTAHVDFTAIGRAAEAAGARRLGLTTQACFLLALGALDFVQDPATAAAGEGHEPAGRLLDTLKDREALKELILPGRMGDRFQVQMLGVGDVPTDLAGLSRPWARPRETAAAAPPSPPRGAALVEESEDRP